MPHASPVPAAWRWALAAGLAGSAGALADAPRTGLAVHHDVSPPLAELVAQARPSPATGFAREVPLFLSPRHLAWQARQRVDEPDPLAGRGAAGAPAAPTPPPSLVFDGSADTDNAALFGFVVVPSDSEGDVGPDHYFQWVNLVFEIFSKAGATLLGPAAGNAFWVGFGGACESQNEGDPQVVYDHLADRWVVSQFTDFVGIQCVAVSTTADPTGTYFRYAFQVAGATDLPDYPKLGIWGDSYGYAADVFSQAGFLSATACAFERAPMLAGQAAQFVCRDFPCTGSECPFGVLPADVEGASPPAGAPIPFFSYWDSAVDGSGFADGVRTWNLNVNWADPPATTLTNPTNLAGASLDRELCNFGRNCIPQPSPGEGLDPLSSKTMWRAHYRVASGYDSVLLNTTVDLGANRAGIRWAELRKTSGTWAFYQEGTHAPADSLHRWMGSLAQDTAGNLCLGYSASSTASFPSVRYTCRSAEDPLGTLPGGEQILQAGAGAQTSSASRWGDYTSLTIDAADGCSFWYTNQYYQTNSSFNFKTTIGSFTSTLCGPATLTVTKSGAGSGTVTSDPAGIDCGTDCVETTTIGAQFSLLPVPDFGSQFDGWSGDADCSDGEVTLAADTTCDARFGACAQGSIVQLPAQQVAGTQTFEACNRLLAGDGGFTLLPGADVTFRAGNEIVLQGGFEVEPGAAFRAEIGPPQP